MRSMMHENGPQGKGEQLVMAYSVVLTTLTERLGSS
jgi:hypothetical protein